MYLGPVTSPCWRQLIQLCCTSFIIMCFKVYVSVALCLASFITFSDGFFLPVFVRKQPPQSPAINNAQWAAPAPSSNSATSNAQPPFSGLKDYNPYQQQSHMTPLQPVQISPLQSLSQAYGYDAASSLQMGMPYQQIQPSFHSVQLVPCLCPISKDVIEQQTQQMQHSPPSPSSPSSSSSSVESGSNSVMVPGKVTS